MNPETPSPFRQDLSARLTASALALAYVSAAVLAASFLFLVVWARGYSQPLGRRQWISHGIAALAHAAAIANLREGKDRPRLVGLTLISLGTAVFFLPGGIFHVMFMPESFLLGAAGVLCLAGVPART
jgi:hypothetical protein